MSNAAWPAGLDALTAAPENHKLLSENDRVRVLDTIIQPGQTTPLHSHQWPAAVYAISVSHFIRRDQNGSVTLDSRNVPLPAPGEALWIQPLPPHTLENIGETEIRFIAIEIKSES